MNNVKYDVIISDRAKRMLGSHMLFLAKVNKNSAMLKKQEILDAIKSLNHTPERCPFFESDFIPHNKYHKLFVAKWYLILFQIRDRTVFVDYIVDCRQNYSWLMI